MKIVSKEETENAFTTVRGSQKAKEIQPPEGEIYVLEDGDEYEIDGPARIDFRSSDQWKRTLISAETKVLKGPLIFANLTPITHDQWVFEARDYADLERYTMPSFIGTLVVLGVYLLVLIATSSPYNGLWDLSAPVAIAICWLPFLWSVRRSPALAYKDVVDIKIPYSPI